MAQIVSFLKSNTELVENPHSWSSKCKRIMYPVVNGAIALACGVIGRTLLQRDSLWGTGAVAGAILLTGLSAESFGKDLYNQYYRPSIVESLPSEFYDELEKRNSEKDNTAPLALFALAEDDHNGAFSLPASRSAMLQIAKTHRLSIRTIRNADDIESSIHEVQHRHGPIDSMYIGAHGNSEGMGLGHAPMLSDCIYWLYKNFGNLPEWLRKRYQPGSQYNLSEKHRDRFKELSGQNLSLISCSTGGNIVSPHVLPKPGIAQTIAQEANKTVWAPEHMGYPDTSLIYPCDSHKLEMNFFTVRSADEPFLADDEQDVIIFHPNNTQTSPCLNLPAFREASFEKEAYLENRAINGELEAQYELAGLYSRPYFKISPPLAAFWNMIYSKDGSGESYFLIGSAILDGFLLNKKPEDGIACILKAAYQNYPPALFLMGLLHENGEIVGKDLEKAKAFYVKAANQQWQNQADSLYRLGLIYKANFEIDNAWGWPFFNTDRAEACFKKGAELNHVPSIFELGCIFEKNGNFEDALQCFERSATQVWEGQAEARVHLARTQYYLGGNLRYARDYEGAIRFLEMSAAQEWDGQANAKFDLAQAQFYLGRDLHLKGDYEGAIRLLEKSATYEWLGQADAKVHLAKTQFWLGWDLGYKRDYEGAIRLLEKSATQVWEGQNQAIFYLRFFLFDFGSLLERRGDLAGAARYLERAAIIGNGVDVELKLGQIYEKLNDYSNAHKWYAEAAMHGSDAAKEAIERLNKVCLIM